VHEIWSLLQVPKVASFTSEARFTTIKQFI
jgi:hypothetical protein